MKSHSLNIQWYNRWWSTSLYQDMNLGPRPLSYHDCITTEQLRPVILTSSHTPINMQYNTYMCYIKLNFENNVFHLFWHRKWFQNRSRKWSRRNWLQTKMYSWLLIWMLLQILLIPKPGLHHYIIEVLYYS